MFLIKNIVIKLGILYWLCYLAVESRIKLSSTALGQYGCCISPWPAALGQDDSSNNNANMKLSTLCSNRVGLICHQKLPAHSCHTLLAYVMCLDENRFRQWKKVIYVYLHHMYSEYASLCQFTPASLQSCHHTS